MLITGGALLASGVDHWTATRAAIVLAQMGEFSFVLAGVGVAERVIDQDQYGLILTAALGSILAMPIMLHGAPMLTHIARYLPFVALREERWVPASPEDHRLSSHVLICGYGRIGSELASSLRERGIGYAVVDINPATIRQLRGEGVMAAFGDAAEEHVLTTIGLATAKTIAITVPDIVATRSIIRAAKLLNPSVAVIARATSSSLVELISAEGAHEVVQPEFEAAMEFTRQVLAWHGVSTEDAIAKIASRRTEVYGMENDLVVIPAPALRATPDPKSLVTEPT